MNRLAAFLCSFLLILPMATAKDHPANNNPATQIAHGKYLVDRVAMCSDCHSPRNARGGIVPGRYLQGAKLEFQPVHPVPGFASVAPAIAGLPGWSTAEAVRLLMSGVGKDGKPLAPPMPQFRMSREDAGAVVAYLKSLHAGNR